MERFASPWEALFPVLDSKGISAPNFRRLSSPWGSLVPAVPPPAPQHRCHPHPDPAATETGGEGSDPPRPRRAAGATSPEEGKIALWGLSPRQEPPGTPDPVYTQNKPNSSVAFPSTNSREEPAKGKAINSRWHV